MLEWGAYGGSKRWSSGVKLIDSVVTRMVVPFMGTSRKFARGVYDGLRGRFFGGSTTGVTNVRRIKGMSFMKDELLCMSRQNGCLSKT